MKFSDEVIAEVARLLQIAILTGTDVVDNLRLVQVKENDGYLFLTDEYSEISESNIEKLQKVAEELEAINNAGQKG